MFKNFNKGISTPITIGIILVLVLLVGGLTIWQYLETKKKELERELASAEEMEWEVVDSNLCRSRKYGFEIETPEDFSVSIGDASYFCQENPKYECLFYVQFKPSSYRTYSSIDLVIFGNPEEKNTIDWLNEYMPRELGDPQAIYIDTEFLVGGENGVKIVSVNGVEANKVYFTENRNMFLMGTSIGMFQEGMRDIFEQTLSTFRFLD